MGAEVKLYKKLKAKTPKIIWNRIENLAIPGMPDLLGYNTNGHFFTVELKVTKSKKLKFSPHQIAFHVTHPNNTFILAETLGPRALNRFHLYRGSRIMELKPAGLELEACSLGLESIRDFLYQLGACRLWRAAWSLSLPTVPAGIPQLEAWSLQLAASFFPRGARHNILDDKKSLILFYQSINITAINILLGVF